MSIGSKVRRKEKRQRERDKEQVMSKMENMYHEQMVSNGWSIVDDYSVTLSNCPTVQATTPVVPFGYEPKAPKKEKNMCYYCEMEAPKTEAQTQRAYLSNRLYSAYNDLEEAATVSFKLHDDAQPVTAEDLIARITAGKFTYKKPEGKTFWSMNVFTGITWRAPDSTPDQAGFDAFAAKIDAAKKDVEDTIQIGTPAEGLAALKAFEATVIA